ncbi:nucleotide pyrophosphohydrolase [Nesterenkonia haasae]|uniref:nucleotide pyrophosphohydrolase n=1 Tax=Nesterenkonia haasae TaxID=2587813 RepID=UPI00139185BD|nr:nucleotide pyrophosphohydrolase [Nesterenkonia haasae]NDK31142.1 nucleotide pyrophosphohydrolase [Nesterenkonia haasae]
MGEESAITRLREFMRARDWEQFHSIENLIKSVSVESGELLECVQWHGQPDTERVKDELADVLTYCFLLADALGSEPEELILAKLQSTEAKYPVDKAKGRSAKYDEL